MTAGDPTFQFGLPSRRFLAEALPSFAQLFPSFALVQGKAVQYFIELATTYELRIFVNDDVYADFYTQVQKLGAAGIRVEVLVDALSVPKETRSQEGKLYSVFTPFKKAVWQKFIAGKPLPEPAVPHQVQVEKIVATLPGQVPATSEAITALFSKERTLLVGGEVIDLATLTPEPQLSDWYYTEAAARARFVVYLKSGDLDAYATMRDSLELDAVGNGKTSKMSLALAWGLISSRTLLSLMQQHFAETFDNPFSTRVSQGALTYISELIWREFYRYQLFHHPELMQTEFQERFRGTDPTSRPRR